MVHGTIEVPGVDGADADLDAFHWTLIGPSDVVVTRCRLMGDGWRMEPDHGEGRDGG